MNYFRPVTSKKNGFNALNAKIGEACTNQKDQYICQHCDSDDDME